MAFTSPESDSSPAKWTPSRASGGTLLHAARSAIAMGRSKLVPSLRRSAGARLMVIRFSGSSIPQFRTAASTRTCASCTALEASPTSFT